MSQNMSNTAHLKFNTNVNLVIRTGTSLSFLFVCLDLAIHLKKASIDPNLIIYNLPPPPFPFIKDA